MSEMRLRYEQREDGLLFYLSDEVRVIVKYESQTRVSAQMWKGEDPDTFTAPDVGNMNSGSFRKRLAHEGERKFGPVPMLEEDLGQVATALQRRVELEEGATPKILGDLLRGLQGPSMLHRLVEYGEQGELFHDPEGEPYATVQVGDHRETYPLRSKRYRNWLRYKLYCEDKARLESENENPEAPRAQMLSDTIAQLEAKAHFEGPEYPVHVRVAEHEGAIYVDLVNEQWEAVEITPEGWTVIPDPPVKFVRAKGMLPLPKPLKDNSGGEKLRTLLNLRRDDEDSFRLLLGWLVAAFRPDRAFVVLILQGEQGSAKSTAERIIRALVDPSTAPLRTTPRNEHDLYIAAINSWVVAYDNISQLQPWLSDAICKLSTGGGFSTRSLYENREQEIFDAMRPIILNGISDVATRPDLLDRSMIVTLPTIPEHKRKPESEVWDEFRDAYPEILGFLLDAVSSALRKLPETKLDRLPRMADFALWVTAAEEALGWEKGSFLDIYDGNRGDANRQALEASAVAVAVWRLVQGEDEWNGTPTKLLRALEDVADEDTKQSKDWPSAPNVLSSQMKRLAPALRAIGIQAEDYREPTAQRRRMWKISHIKDDGKGPSEASEASEGKTNSSETEENSLDGLRTIPGGLEGPSGNPLHKEESPASKGQLDSLDGLDDGPEPSHNDENHGWVEGEV